MINDVIILKFYKINNKNKWVRRTWPLNKIRTITTKFSRTMNTALCIYQAWNPWVNPYYYKTAKANITNNVYIWKNGTVLFKVKVLVPLFTL